MAQTNWQVSAEAAWSLLVEQGKLRRLRAYHEADPSVAVDLGTLERTHAAEDHLLLVEPTPGTFTRLNELGASVTAG